MQNIIAVKQSLIHAAHISWFYFPIILLLRSKRKHIRNIVVVKSLYTLFEKSMIDDQEMFDIVKRDIAAQTNFTNADVGNMIVRIAKSKTHSPAKRFSQFIKSIFVGWFF